LHPLVRAFVRLVQRPARLNSQNCVVCEPFHRSGPGYFKSVRDEEQEISDLVVQCVEVTGRYTEATNWIPHMLPRLLAKGVSSLEQIAQLIVLGGLLRGGDPAGDSQHVLPNRPSQPSFPTVLPNRFSHLRAVTCVRHPRLHAVHLGGGYAPSVPFVRCCARSSPLSAAQGGPKLVSRRVGARSLAQLSTAPHGRCARLSPSTACNGITLPEHERVCVSHDQIAPLRSYPHGGRCVSWLRHVAVSRCCTAHTIHIWRWPAGGPTD
jgi:hypothetical protein